MSWIKSGDGSSITAPGGASSNAVENPTEFSEFSKDEKKTEEDGEEPAQGGEEQDEFADFDDYPEEMVQGGGFGELQGLVRRSKNGNLILTDDVMEADEELQFLAFREVTRSFLVDGRDEKGVTSALLLEQSADTEDSEQVVLRAEQFWAKEFEKLSIETPGTKDAEETQEQDGEPDKEAMWEKSFAKKVLQNYFDATVESTGKPSNAPRKSGSIRVEDIDHSWVHKEEAEIAKALSGTLAKDRKRNKILNKLSQLGQKLTPEDAAEMARAQLAAAEAAAAVGETKPVKKEVAFETSRAGQPRSNEREEVNLRAFVKMDPDVTLEQLGLFVKTALNEEDLQRAESAKAIDSQKSVKISNA